VKKLRLEVAALRGNCFLLIYVQLTWGLSITDGLLVSTAKIGIGDQTTSWNDHPCKQITSNF
jgi:hypothetical protein